MNDAWTISEMRKQVKLLCSQREFIAVQHCSSCESVNVQRTDDDRRTLCRFGNTCATNDGANSGNKLLEPERLCHIVIGANVQAEDTIQFLVARSQHNYRNLARYPKSATNLEAVYVR